MYPINKSVRLQIKSTTELLHDMSNDHKNSSIYLYSRQVKHLSHKTSRKTMLDALAWTAQAASCRGISKILQYTRENTGQQKRTKDSHESEDCRPTYITLISTNYLHRLPFTNALAELIKNTELSLAESGSCNRQQKHDPSSMFTVDVQNVNSKHRR